MVAALGDFALSTTPQLPIIDAHIAVLQPH
jgi:hypothetical protein